MRSSSLIAAEITVRVIVIILQLVAVVGGGLLIGLFPTDGVNTIIVGVGSASIGVGCVVLFYEIIMIIFSFTEKVNHPARLMVDIKLNTVMAVLSILATLGAIAVGVLLFVIFIAAGGVIIAIFALPIGLGIIYSIAFIVSAISSGIIRSKLISQARQAANQPAPVVGTEPTTFIMVPQQPLYINPQSGYPPSYNSAVTPASGSGLVEYQTPGAYPTAAVSVPYYDMPLPPGVTKQVGYGAPHPGYP